MIAAEPAFTFGRIVRYDDSGSSVRYRGECRACNLRIDHRTFDRYVERVDVNRLMPAIVVDFARAHAPHLAAEADAELRKAKEQNTMADAHEAPARVDRHRGHAAPRDAEKPAAESRGVMRVTVYVNGRRIAEAEAVETIGLPADYDADTGRARVDVIVETDTGRLLAAEFATLRPLL